ncbi:MAG: PIN domain-containing protein [Microbacterium sp.]
MPTSADYLLDTSAALALLDEDHPLSTPVRALCHGLTLGLSGHARTETYSVLTRLPGSDRLSPQSAAHAIGREFPLSVALSPAASLAAVETLAAAGIAGGAVYDGLVGLAAREAGIPLLSCDRRALSTYAVLGVEVRIV